MTVIDKIIQAEDLGETCVKTGKKLAIEKSWKSFGNRSKNCCSKLKP